MGFKSAFYTISFSEFCDRLSYYGLQSLLVLYLVNHFGFSVNSSYSIYGSYAAVAFGSCIIGGIVADRFLTQYQAVFMGILLLLLGNFFLGMESSHFPLFALGVALVTVGLGFVKPATACLMGSLYTEKPAHNEKAFTYFYIIGGVGSILGPLLYGIGINSDRYWVGFSCSVVALVVNIIFFSVNQKLHHCGDPTKKNSFIRAFITMALLITLAFLVFAQILLIAWLLLPAFVVCIFFIFKVFKFPLTDNSYTTLRLSIPILASILFFVVFLQLFATVTLFIVHHVNTVVLGWHVPATWFSALEALLLLMIAPVVSTFSHRLSFRKSSIKTHNKILIGLVATSLAFLTLAASAYACQTSSAMAISLIVFSNLLLAIGEICVIPTSLLLIHAHSPHGYKGILMGVFYFLLSFSGYLSGLLAQAAPAKTLLTPIGFVDFFSVIAVALFILTLLLYAFDKLLLSSLIKKQSISN